MNLESLPVWGLDPKILLPSIGVLIIIILFLIIERLWPEPSIPVADENKIILPKNLIAAMKPLGDHFEMSTKNVILRVISIGILVLDLERRKAGGVAFTNGAKIMVTGKELKNSYLEKALHKKE